MSLPEKPKTREEMQMEARTKAVALACEAMAKWYILSNSGVGPKECVEMRKGDTVLRWMDPPLFGVDNPLLIEDYTRGFWSLRTEKLPKVS